MIQWNLTLTGNQIAVLKSLKDREFGKEWDGGKGITHWITGVRPLIREGLIEHRQTMMPNGKYVDPLRTGQFITERGRFILKMIEQDLAQFLGVSEKPSAPPRKGSAAA